MASPSCRDQHCANCIGRLSLSSETADDQVVRWYRYSRCTAADCSDKRLLRLRHSTMYHNTPPHATVCGGGRVSAKQNMNHSFYNSALSYTTDFSPD